MLRPTSAPTGLPVPHSILGGSSSGACSSSTRTKLNKCVSVSTPLATISRCWNSALNREACQNPPFSQTSISTRWRTFYPRCSFQSAMEGPMQRRWGGERCLSPITAEELRFSKTVFQHALHKPDDTGPTISCPNFSHRTATIAQLRTYFAGSTVLCGIVLNVSDVCRTCA